MDEELETRLNQIYRQLDAVTEESNVSHIAIRDAIRDRVDGGTTLEQAAGEPPLRELLAQRDQLQKRTNLLTLEKWDLIRKINPPDLIKGEK